MLDVVGNPQEAQLGVAAGEQRATCLRNSIWATSAKNSVAAKMTICATAGVTAATTGATRLICDGSTFTVLAAGGISVFCRSRNAASGRSST